MVSGPSDEPLALLVILTVRHERLEEFREFERNAARILYAHGGSIEQALVFPLDGEHSKEVHVVSFPSARAFDAYRHDAELIALAPLRERAIVSTEIWSGRKGPDYMAQVRRGATLGE
jgi:hypothetical protein